MTAPTAIAAATANLLAAILCAATEGRMEWANLTGEYQDVTDYARMCVSCHRKFDAARRALTGRRTSPRR